MEHVFANDSFKEESYNGGGNITFKGTLEDNVPFTIRLFQGELLLDNVPLVVTYSVSFLIWFNFDALRVFHNKMASPYHIHPVKNSVANKKFEMIMLEVK